MKPFILNLLALLVAAATLFCINATAATFHLKDGRELEGRLVSQNEESYVIEVLVGRGIWDEMILKKDEVRKIEREKPDQKSYDVIRDFVPTPDMLPTAEYDRRLNLIREFIREYPDSERIGEVREMLEVIQHESDVILQGGVKLHGELISADDRSANKFEIDARSAAAEIQRMAKAGNVLATLRAFHEFETGFSESEAWQALLPMIQQLVSRHQSRAREMLDAMDGRMARQESGLSRMAMEERQSAMRAIAERDASLKARHEKERVIRNYWPSIHPDYPPALQDTVRLADTELRRLSTAANQPLRSPTKSELWRNAFTAINSGDANQIRQALQSARTGRLPQAYLDELQAMADAAEEARRLEEARALEEAKRLEEAKAQEEAESTAQDEE